MGIKKSPKGFTFIELIIVTAVIGVVLPALFAIIFSVLRQQIKVNRLAEVKRQGDYVLNVIQSIINNNGIGIYYTTDPSTLDPAEEVCYDDVNNSYGPTDGNNFYFMDNYEKWFSFYLDGTKISSDAAILAAPVDLTTPAVRITNFEIGCNRTSLYSPPLVTVKFTIEYNTDSTRAEDKASLNYQTLIKLKNY